MKTTGIKILILALGICGIYSCDSSNNNPADGDLSPKFISQMQNSAGCLDAGLALQKASRARNGRSTVTDIEIPKNDGEVSDAFLSSAVQNTDLSDRPSQISFEQDGCDSITVRDSAGEEHLKIIEASSTKIVTDRSAQEHFSFELVADHELQIRETLPYTTPHNCGNETEETHDVTIVALLQWGKSDSSAPAISDHLAGLERTAQEYRSPVDMGRDDDYCRNGRR